MLAYTSFFSVIIVAFVVSTTICPIGIWFFKTHWQANKSTTFRQMHKETIPRSGGLGIVLGFWGSIGILLLLNSGLVVHYFQKNSLSSFIFWLAILSLASFTLGFVDDLFYVRARYKLILQISIALAASLTILPFREMELPFLGIVQLGNAGIFLAVFWIVGIMNAINLIDGLDTLAGGVIIIALGGVLWIAWQRWDLFFLTISFTLVASILGFLIFNRFPAKIFMGDGGSMFLGFLIAILPMAVVKTHQEAYSLTPVILLGLPIVDTLFSILRRFLRGIPIFSADKSHIHHKLIEKGLSHQQAVRRLHCVSLCYLGIFIVSAQQIIDLKMAFVAFGACTWLLIFFAGYEEIVQPFVIIKNRKSSKDDRSFQMQLSYNIETFFKHAVNVDELFFALSVWARQMQVVELVLVYGDKKLCKTIEGEKTAPHLLKKLQYDEGSVSIMLFVKNSYLDLDSDSKYQAINQVINTTFDYLKKNDQEILRHTFHILEKKQ